MSLISSSYFIGPIILPTKKFDLITGYISRHENEIIYKLFGYTLGNLIIAYNSETSPQRIKDIVEGKEYTVSPGPCYYGVKGCDYYMPTSGDVTIKWKGLTNTQFISLIAYWVFYWYCRENEINITPAGGIKPMVEDAVNVGFIGKATFAWRELLELYGYFGQSKMKPSCFNFMSEHYETYPEWIFEGIGSPGSVNIFGI